MPICSQVWITYDGSVLLTSSSISFLTSERSPEELEESVTSVNMEKILESFVRVKYLPL